MSSPRVRFSLVRLPPAALFATAWVLSCGQSLPEEVRVRRVIDGDTVELMDGRLLRYAGIDAPEVRRRARHGDREWRAGEGDRWVVDPEPLGQDATEANKQLVEGKMVRLEYDVQTHDRFGRLLAYAYVSANGRSASGGGKVMVNAELLREGLAQPMTIPPNVKYAERFRVLTGEARQGRRGLWKTPTCRDESQQEGCGAGRR